MKVNAHNHTFFSPLSCFFSLALRGNKSTAAHAHTFFRSIHMRFSLAPRGNSTKYAHTEIFSVHSLRFSQCSYF